MADTGRQTGPLVVYYSRTGTTASLARSIADALEMPTIERIRPRTERRYANWLVRSAIPGSTVPIQRPSNRPSAFDTVLLGTPKWTLSCPPVSAYLQRTSFDGVRVGVVLTYGGFDERRYARRLVDRLQRDGATVRATLLVQRDRVDTPGARAGIERFLAAMGRS